MKNKEQQIRTRKNWLRVYQELDSVSKAITMWSCQIYDVSLDK